ELAIADLHWRLRRDEGVHVEFFLQRFPELAAHLLDLVEAEILSRRNNQEEVGTEEYVRRFPDHEGPIRNLLGGLLASGSTVLDAAPADPPSDDVPPTLLGCQLRPPHRLGAGGMGVIWLGLDENLGRPVAVKVVKRRWRGHNDV